MFKREQACQLIDSYLAPVMDQSTNVLFDIFFANVCEIAKGTETKEDKFVVEGVEFAEGRDMVGVAEQSEDTFKGAGTGD